MMNIRIRAFMPVIFLFALFSLSSGAQAFTRADWDLCHLKTVDKAQQKASRDACTRLINDQSLSNKVDRAAVFLSRGANFHNYEKDYDSAIADTSESIRLNPNVFHAYSNRVNSYWARRKAGDKQLALADIAQAMKISPENAQLYYVRSRITVLGPNTSTAEWESALQDISRAIRGGIEDADTYYLRGLIFRVLDKEFFALQDFTESLRRDPSRADVYRSRASAYRSFFNCKDAIGDYTALIRIDPKDKEALYQRGFCYARDDEDTNAINDFNEVLKLDPTHKDALKFSAPFYFRKGNAEAIKGNREAAIANFTEALRRDTQDAMSHVRRGTLYMDIGEYAKAEEDFKELLRLNRTEFWQEQGKQSLLGALIMLKRYDEVLIVYNARIDKEPEELSHYLNRALIYIGKSQPDKAIEDCNFVLKRSPDNTDALVDRAFAHVAKGNIEKALEDMAAAIKAGPDEALTYVLYAEVLERIGRTSEAETARKKAYTLDHDLPSLAEIRKLLRPGGYPI